METIVNLIYTVSPRHTDAYYATKAREAAGINPYRICFKDVGGLLTPERARSLIPAILQNAGAVPVEYHAHCNNGLATLCYIEAKGLLTKNMEIFIECSLDHPSVRTGRGSDDYRIQLDVA